FSLPLLPPGSPPFPYTTLFRSLVLLIVLGLALSSDSGKGPKEEEETKGPAAIKRIDVEVEDVRKLVSAGKQELRDAENLEGAAKDRKSTRLNSSHSQISYAVFC